MLTDKITYIENNIDKIDNELVKNELQNYVEFHKNNKFNTDQTIHILIKKGFYTLNNIVKITGKNVKKFTINDLKILNINSVDDIKIVETFESDETIYSSDEDDSSINDHSGYEECIDSDEIFETVDNDGVEDTIIKKKKMLEIMRDKNRIPNMKIINDNFEKIKKIQNLKNILVENDNINISTLEIMQNQICEIENTIGININKVEKEDNENNECDDHNEDNTNTKNINNDENIYFGLYGIIEKWIKYKIEKKDYLHNVNKILDKCIYGHKDAKKQISRLIGQWMNGKMTGTCIGFCGPPGVGKTSICKNGLSKCLIDKDGNTRPFAFLPLGGTSNGPLLEGHHYTYLGSTWGKIVDILLQSKCMNPIIYIDELDKISNTENGKEIMSILTHLTDPTQNMEFNDRYFAGIPLDLSKAIFVFSYNDSNKVDRILRDRIHEIQIKPLNKNEKIKITKNYLLPDILTMVGFNMDDIYIKNNEIEFLIENYTYEAGVRKLNEHLLILIREINLRLIMDDNNIQLPFSIKKEFIKEVFSEKQLVKLKKIFPKPQVGLVNGLYATNSGLGGLQL